MKRTAPLLITLSFLCGLFLLSCKKDSIISSADARLSLSADTLKYDTVFTSTGSVTKSFKIFNNNDQKLRISSVKLMGGAASAYKMNVDGVATTGASDLLIDANDSIYVFVSVTINPNAANLPFIVSDSIQLSYNGNTRYVQLQAYGQNANFLRNRVITGNVVWPNNLPYVILGSLRIDTTATLTLSAGCRIYSHADAPFIVDGTLIINGTKTDSVVFAGDRLDPDYKNLPAGWPGIYFRGTSKNNVLTHAIIKNAYQAVVAEKPSINANPKLVLHQCIIDNAYDAGLLCVNTSMQADNCLISNCGGNVALLYGGTYNMTHCTVAAYSTSYFFHKTPVLQVTNFTAAGSGGNLTADINAVFRNCIFWGDEGFINNEISVLKDGSNIFNVLFDKNLYRAQTDPSNATFSGNLKNLDPLFDSIDVYKHYFDFHITKNASAPGINSGALTSFPKDLDDKTRNFGIPDMGCYEKQ
ncbi:MAG: hypothetical protein U0X40_01300 [Ferruginibacter sp.]